MAKGIVSYPHVHGPSDVTDLAEYIRDTIAAALVAGSNVTITTNDGANTITIAASGGGGGGSLTDGDYGDITVSGTGTVLSIDAGVVSTTELGGDITTAGKALLDDADAAAQRTTLGLGTAATQASTAFAAASHTHAQSDVTNLTTDLAAKVPTARTINGYDLSANRTLTAADVGAAATSHTHAQSDITGLVSDLAGKQATGNYLTALTGDVTASGPGSAAATIANDAVTYAKIQNVSATDKLLGRATTGAGDIEEIACTAAGRALLDDADAAAQRTTLGLGTLATQSGTFSGTSSGTNTGDQTISLTGDVTGSGTGSFAATIAAGAVTLAKQANMATASLVYRKTAGSGAPEVNTLATLKTDLGLTGTNSGDQTISLTGDVTGSGTGSFAATVANDAISNAKLANMAASTLKGRVTASAGDPEDLTGTQATTLLDVFTSALKGLAPASGGGTSNFLRADGTWAAPAGGGGGGLTVPQAMAIASLRA